MSARAHLLGRMALALAYAGVYHACYVLFLHYHFAYVGFDLYERAPLFIALSVVIAVLPVLCYRGLRGISSAIAVIVYLALYVPIVVTFALGSVRPTDEIILVQCTFMLGMALLFLADVVIVKLPLALDVGMDLMPAVLVGTVLGTLYVLAVYRGHMSFVGFGEELYDQRFANESLGAGLVTRYLTSWLSTVLVPLCLAYGLTARKYRYVAAASLACLVMYMGAANKISILLPFVYVGFFLAMRRRMSAFFAVATGLLTVLIAVLMLKRDTNDSVGFVVSSILLFRTIGNGGQLAVAYYDFFSIFPRTNYAHVKGLNLLAPPYPYGHLGVGEVVGQYFTAPLQNSNASFWVTDGIAAMGLLGVVAVSLVCAMLLAVMNSVTRKYDPLFVLLTFLSFVVMLLNQSLFSSFWSGGALFLMLFFLFNRRDADRAAVVPTPHPALP